MRQQFSRNINPPIVVGGVGGSGTRLVAQFLNNLGVDMGSTVNASYDQLWFTLLFRRKCWIKTIPTEAELEIAFLIFDAICHGNPDYLNTDQTKELLNQLVNDLQGFGLSGTPFNSWRELKKERITRREYLTSNSWGWKEPNTHVFLKPLSNFYPNLKYIHVIRHGLDMALSSNQNQTKQWHKWFDLEHKELTPQQKESFDFWFFSNLKTQNICQSDLSGRHIWIKYEDICEHPLKTAHQIANFLQIKLTDVAESQLSDSVVTNFISKYKGKNLSWIDASVEKQLKSFNYIIE